MSSDFSDQLFQHLLDRFPGDRDYARGALYAEGMPPLVAGLLGRTLDRWLEHELDSLESRWFDFNDPAVRAARAELVVALSRTARVPRGAWAETLKYAVGLVVRHLVIPARALTDATFEGGFDPLPRDAVRARIHMFDAYSYLPEIADAWLTQKRPETLTPDSLHDLLRRIDKRVCQDYNVEDWLQLLAPLFALVHVLPSQRGIPPDLLATFFRAKGKKEIADRFEVTGKPLDEFALAEFLRDAIAEAPASAPTPVDATPKPEPEPVRETPDISEPSEDVEDIPVAIDDEDDSEQHQLDLDDFSPETGEIESEAIIVEESPGSKRVGDETLFAESGSDVDESKIDTDVLNLDEEEAPEGDDEPLPLWKRYTSNPPEAVVPPPTQTTNNANGTTGTPLWQRFLSGLRGSTSAEEAPVTDVAENAPITSTTPLLDDLEREILGENAHKNRRKYVRELFRGDESAYATVLQRLSTCRTWSQASQIIAQDIFRKYEIDIYSDVAVAFTNSANKKFE